MQDTYSVTAGLEWMQQQIVNEGRYLLWNQLSFAESDPNVHLAVGLAKERTDSREKPTAMGARMDAVGGVNGGFFATESGPVGLVIRDQKLVAPHSDRRPPRTALEVRKDGSIGFERLAWRKDHLETIEGEARPDVVMALGAGPRLVRDAKAALTTDLEELGPKGNDITRIAARTAVGVTRNNRVQVVVATGYHDLHMQGLTLDELATLMVSQGATQAMNLDGGSSTSMFVGNKVVSNGVGAPPLEKAVGTGLLVVDHRPQLFPSDLRLSLAASQLIADGKSTLQLTVSANTPGGSPVPDGTPVRAYPDGVWLDSQVQSARGGQVRFSIQSLTRVGPASIRVESGAAVASSELRLVPAEASELWTRMNINNPGETQLGGEQLVFVTSQVNDRFGNPVPGVNVTMTGAPVGDVSSLTGANGVATLAARMPQAGGVLEIRGPGLPTRRLQVPAVVPTPGPGPTPSPAGPAPTGDPIPSPVRPYLR